MDASVEAAAVEMLKRGESPDAVRADLVANGVSRDDAAAVVARLLRMKAEASALHAVETGQSCERIEERLRADGYPADAIAAAMAAARPAHASRQARIEEELADAEDRRRVARNRAEDAHRAGTQMIGGGVTVLVVGAVAYFATGEAWPAWQRSLLAAGAMAVGGTLIALGRRRRDPL